MLCYRCGTYAPDGSPKCPGCGQIFQKTNAGEKRKSSQTRQPQAIFSVGETVAERYKILDVIGQGGVGTVYRAHDTDIDVEVALKAVAPKLLQTSDEQKTFSKFIKTARKLHHANIVRIYDEGRDTGPQGERRFFTMQLLEGLTLRKIIQLRREKSQVFQVAEVEPIFQQLAAALDYAHKTVWHGDLKPENVLVLPDLLKVTDFCIIQALPTKPFLAIQKSRGAAYHYIAPEVRLEASRIDGRADVYSLGVMLAEMLTGELYEGHANKNFQKALEQLPRSLEALLRRATHESADNRVQSAGELAEGLADIVARGETTRSPDPAPAPRSLPPPPPPSDSGVHDAPNMHVQTEGSIPQLSESSVIMLEHVQQSATDVTQLPDGTPASDETPVVGLKSKKVEAVLELDTDEQRTGAANRGKPPPAPPADEPQALGPPTHEDTQQDSPPDSAEQDLPPVPVVQKGANGHAKGNGAAKKDPYGPPPPLPDDPSDSGRMVSGPEGMSIHDEPTLSEKASKVGIHDQLTSLRPNPTRAQEATMPRGSILPPSERPTTAMPPSGPAAIPVPPPPPREPPRKENRGTPLLAIFAIIGVVMGAGGFFAYREYSRVKRELDAARQNPPVTAPLTNTPSTSDPAAAANAAAEEARRKAEAEAAAKVAEQEAARKKAEEEAAVRRAAEEEAARKKAEEEAARNATANNAADEKKRKEEEKRAAAEEAKRKKEEEKAAAEEARRKKEEERLANADDKKRKEEERRAQAEEAKRKKDEEQAARAEEKKRKDEERAAKAEEAKRKKEEEQAARAAAEEEKKRAKEEAAAKKKAEEEAAARNKNVAQVDPSQLSCPKGMALIPGGTFKMGSAANDPMHNFEEKRLESVELKPFCIDYYEFPNSKAAKPTTSVSWFQAQELCKGKGKRLCEEDEWEKACKGPDNDRYPYGNSWDPDRCNTQDAEGNDRELAEQKAFPKCRSGFGIINMSGNAAEWVASSFSASVKDRVHKGGSANRPDWATRCANRANLAPSGKNPFVGFRCCADPVVGATE